MADVMGAFLRGRQFAQAEAEHQQVLEENKLRTQILKHQIDGMKIEDQLRTRALQQQNLELMTGQPEADMPRETVSQNLPARSFAGSMTGLPGGDQTVSSSLSPNAQNPTPESVTRAKPVTISGVPQLGVGDVQVRPRSLEDIVRASVATKMMEPYDLARGAKRMIGNQTIAEGEPYPAPRPTRASIALDANKGDPAAAMRDLNAGSRQNTFTEVKDVTLDGKPTPLMKDSQGNWYDLNKNPIKNAAARIGQKPAGTPTAQANVDLRTDEKTRAEYNLFARAYRDEHPQPKDADFAAAAAANKPAPTKPPAPPSFDKWLVMTKDERQKAIKDPNARISDSEMMSRQKAGKTNAPAAAGGDQGGAKKFSATEVAGFLKQAPKGKESKVTLTDGTVWHVFKDGQYEQIQ
jgi:hypothetical protein